ncbi:MAG TPA: hypothetical protein PL045_02895 [Chitinophagaceae bacterium]|nr:hypothetical protein [Chitinophagaceae bacterium]
MITFDRKGNPKPAGIVKTTLSDFKSFFVDAFHSSVTRLIIYDKWQDYISDFKREISPAFTQWINGSYTTNKINPNDIDLVNLVEYTEELNDNSALLNFLTVGSSKRLYKVDGYLVPIYEEEDPRHSLTKQQLNYWKNWFGHDRQGN